MLARALMLHSVAVQAIDWQWPLFLPLFSLFLCGLIIYLQNFEIPDPPHHKVVYILKFGLLDFFHNFVAFLVLNASLREIESSRDARVSKK